MLGRVNNFQVPMLCKLGYCENNISLPKVFFIHSLYMLLDKYEYICFKSRRYYYYFIISFFLIELLPIFEEREWNLFIVKQHNKLWDIEESYFLFKAILIQHSWPFGNIRQKQWKNWKSAIDKKNNFTHYFIFMNL